MAIAGSDPSGGAGIQADIKTFTTLGVYAGAVITCLTAQNSRGVAEWQPLNPDFFKKQLNLVINDLPISHIKIGMVGSSELSFIITEELAGFRGEIVYDPVITASDGHSLCEPGGIEAVKQVCGTATVLTPNLDELQALSGMRIDSHQKLLSAVYQLFNQFPRLRLILAKGGHINQKCSTVRDYLFKRRETDPLIAEHPRIKTGNSHGTGCTLASAFTAFHLLGNNDELSFCQAGDYVRLLLERSKACKLGKGTGPLVHVTYVSAP